FGASISSPNPGGTFTEYNEARGLETFEPCSIGNFAEYGRWFQQETVPWLENVNVVQVAKHSRGFQITLSNGEDFVATHVVAATGLSHFAYMPCVLASLPSALLTHTAAINRFADFRGLEVAVIGAGQSALEAAALLNEFGARPQLLARDAGIRW